MTAEKTVTFHFAPFSRYAYLASTQIERIAKVHRVRFDWMPYDNVTMFQRRGVSSFSHDVSSGQYDWNYRTRDAAAWADYYGVPYNEPRDRGARFNQPELLSACMAAREMGAVEAIARGFFARLFASDAAEVTAVDCIDIAAASGLDSAAFEERMSAPATAAAVASATDAAYAAGVFGVPTFVLDGRMFWGNDRLVLLEHHLDKSG